MIGHRLHGRGPRHALLLHGWFGDHGVYRPALPAFDPETWTLALMDQRGYGLSRDRGGPFDIATIAADALDLTDRLGWDRVSLIGHSMGGKAALRVAVAAPARVERLLAVTPVWAGAAPFDDATKALFRAAAGDAGAREGIIRHSTSDRLPADLYRELVAGSFAQSREESFAAYFESWSGDDFADRVAGLDVPVAVLIGEQDLAITADLVRATWMAVLPAAELLVMAGVGHYPMLEDPAAFGALAAGWLGR
ncbi:alpha/beta fold hydrolase [Niveispirillum sp. KHB5.9]|uniref:alpha/beta fold hydrolase n=1 Tax=Niveispirillum sp. KHB5.9 TaxID=3400269 RepID=UPI003A8999F5